MAAHPHQPVAATPISTSRSKCHLDPFVAPDRMALAFASERRIFSSSSFEQVVHGFVCCFSGAVFSAQLTWMEKGIDANMSKFHPGFGNGAVPSIMPFQCAIHPARHQAVLESKPTDSNVAHSVSSADTT
ncbi:MAG: hypothetical protein MI923_11835 [Phycisphaerales bacterium]|nr:hypothetical protein [Phycisphaerales bacterium]